MTSEKSNVTLGCIEKCEETWALESRYFPSKVGGRPAWLDLKNINVDVSCTICSDPCLFLCQIYAPIDSQPSAYHRTIFVFVCKNPNCCKSNSNNNFKVFRCQLPLVNDYYPPEEPTDDPDWSTDSKVEKFNDICHVCGCLGSYQCSKCKLIKYCSKSHQVFDWKTNHKNICNSVVTTTPTPENSNNTFNLLFPEYEIIEEEEEEKCDDSDENITESKTEEKKSYEERFNDLKQLLEEGNLQNASDDLLMDLDNGKEYKYLKHFKTKLKLVPDQVVRYARGGTPLWISEPKYSNEDIPFCEECMGPRQFEFQILPTLLSYLDVDKLDDSLDWGNLLIYTCKNNCDEGPAYKKEFLWKQDLT